jgi:hypothetical protein
MATGAYRFSVCVDVVDELLVTWLDAERLHRLFRRCRELGAGRIYWIYTFPPAAEALVPCVWQGVAEHAQESYRRVGDLLPAAVAAAHDLGLELFAVYKPFDLALNATLPHGSELARRYGKGFSSLSGELCMGHRELAALQHQRLACDLRGLPADLDQRVIRTLRFTGQDDRPLGFDPAQLTLTVSDDNGTYRPYAGPLAVRQDIVAGHRVVTLDGLALSSRYFALHLPPNAAPPTLANHLTRFAAVLDDQGRALPCTFGLLSRRDQFDGGAMEVPLGVWPPYRDCGGYVFNAWDFAAPYHPLVALDGRHGYLALARGKEPFVAGALSPAFPEVRQFWLGQVRECLTAGVDGVDLRIAQHNRAFIWEEYGFEAPVADEYRRRHGAELDASPAARDRQVELLAECFNEFVREMAATVRGHGARVQLHVQPLQRRYMGLKWDWETWLRESWADELTLKGAAPGDAATHDRLAPLLAARPLALHACPWLIDAPHTPAWQADFTRQLVAAARAGREAGCILYETATFFRVQPDGDVVELHPGILAAVHAARRALAE